jgi:acyl carrier protein
VTLRDLLARRTAGALDLGTLADATPLGADGVGLDSVAIVEILLECETEFGVRLPPKLFDGGPVTIGALAAAIEAARARRPSGS